MLRIKSQLTKLGLTCLAGLTTCPLSAEERELVILTTFSKEPLTPLIIEFNKRYPDVEVKVIHRRSQSSIQLLNRSYIQDIDLVLSSSPFLMQKLALTNKLVTMPHNFEAPQWLTPYILPPQKKVVPIGYSGAGIVWNNDYLTAHKLPTPNRFKDLTNPVYFGHITMSTPSRSGTTQMMIESILQHYGWKEGWQIILNVAANFATISSRSFGVSDYIAKGEFGIGPTIDSYAHILKNKFEHLSFAYDPDFTLMPTYIAQTSQPHNDKNALNFIELLRSEEVQSSMGENNFSKRSINDKSLYSDGFPTLSMHTMTIRETAVNQIFDLAITKRLPELKDTWLSIISLKKLYGQHPQILRQLEDIQQQLFRVPIQAEQAIELGQEITARQEPDSPLNQALLAEFNHHLGNALAKDLMQANNALKALKRDSVR